MTLDPPRDAHATAAHLTISLPEGAARALAACARDAALVALVALARDVLGECDAASVSFGTPQGPVTLAWAGDMAKLGDEKQYAADTGPCVMALGGSPAMFDVRTADTEWAPIAAAARALGIGTILSLPAPNAGGAGLGVNLYSRVPGAFAEGRAISEAVALQAGRVFVEPVPEVALRSAALVEAAFDEIDIGVHAWRALASEAGLDHVLQSVAAAAARAMPFALAASITLEPAGEPFTSHSTGELASGLDQTQYDAGVGPCLHALRTGSTVTAVVGTAHPWPEFDAVAAARGVGRVLAVPLAADGAVSGVLNVYGEGSEAFDDGIVDMATVLAEQGGIAVASAWALRAERRRSEQLWEALDTRDIIGQAKGIVMATRRCSSTVAFDVLRRESQHSNRKLRDIAVELVRATERPQS